MSEDLDIDFLFYCYTTILGKSEGEFWKSTPRKIISQMKIYRNIKKPIQSENEKTEKGKIKGLTISLKAVN